VDDVQLQLAPERISECARVAARGLDTDKNFAVLEREHISRTQSSEKLPMQERHPPIGNKPYEKFARLPQVGSFPLSQVQTMLEGIRCEPFEFCSLHRNFSLKVSHVDAWQRRISHCQTPIAAFSFSARNTAMIVHIQILLMTGKSCVPIQEGPASTKSNEHHAQAYPECGLTINRMRD
jgi:hypothetical protein